MLKTGKTVIGAIRPLTTRETCAVKWALDILAGNTRARDSALDRLEGSVAQTMRHELSRRPDMTPAEIAATMLRDQAGEGQALPPGSKPAIPGPAEPDAHPLQGPDPAVRGEPAAPVDAPAEPDEDEGHIDPASL